MKMFPQKNVAIAKSGVYQYRKEEVASMLGLSLDTMPAEFAAIKVFNVYRPAPILAAAAPMFTSLPVTNEHPHVEINQDNFRDFALGWTGDTATVEYLKDAKEVIIRSTLFLRDREAVNAYRSGKREVSPGYQAKFSWTNGVAPTGEKYQIIMDAIEGANHLAMTAMGRGGKEAAILDSKMIHSGLIYAITHDSDMGAFRDLLDNTVANRATMSDEEFDSVVEQLTGMMGELPDTEEKEQLGRYLLDVPTLKSLDDESAKKFGDVVSNLFESLDADAMEDASHLKDSDMNFFKKFRSLIKDDDTVSPDKGGGEAMTTKNAGKPIDEEKPEAPVAKAEMPMEKEAKIGSIHDVPDPESDEFSSDHLKYVIKEIMEFLKKNGAGEEAGPTGNKEEVPTPAGDPTDESPDMPAAEKHMHIHVGDSKGRLFNSSVSTRDSAKSAEDFFAAMGPVVKRGKK